MKVKITNKVSGEFRVPIMDRTYRRGIQITMTEDEFFDSGTQWAIRNGYLSVIEDANSAPTKPQGSEFRLVSRNPLSLRCVGRTINPGEVFYVPHDKLGDGDLSIVVNRGMVVSEVDFQKKITPETTTAAVLPDSVPEVPKIVKAGRGKKAKTATAEITTVPNEEIPKAETPPNMHVHVPHAVKGDVKPRTAPGRSAVMLDLDSDTEEDVMDFVDKKPIISRKVDVAKNNEEVE